MDRNVPASICAAGSYSGLWRTEPASHKDKASHLGMSLSGSSLPEQIAADRDRGGVEVNQRLRG